MNTARSELSRPLKLIAFMTGRDPEVLSRCGKQDINDTIALFVTQILSASLIFLVSAYGLSIYLPGVSSLPLAALVTLLLFFFDRAILSSDWELKGILAEEGAKSWLKTAPKLAIRLALSAFVVLGLLSLPLDLRLQSGALHEILDRNHKESNRAFYEPLEALRKKSEEKQHQLASEIVRLEQEKVVVRERLDEISLEHARTLTEKQHYQEEAQREEDGIGRPEGTDKLWRLAILKEEQAETRLQELSHQKYERESRLRDLDRQKEMLKQEVQHVLDNYKRERESLIAELKEEGKFTEKERSADLMLLWQARRQLHEDPVRGPAARYFSYMLGGALMFLELLPLVKQSFFNSASLYQVRRNANTRLEAARVIHELRDDLNIIRQNAKPKVINRELRVVKNDSDKSVLSTPDNSQKE